MKLFGRFTLLGSFAAIGTGLAICMATSADPSAEEANRPPSRLVAVGITPDDPPAGGPASVGARPSAVSPRLPKGEAGEGPSQASRPVLVAPSGPLAAEYIPPPREYFAQMQTPSDNVIEYLQRQLNAPAAPLPRSASGGAPPAAGGLPPATGGLPPPPAAPAAKPGRSVVKADPEGDGKLTINIQNGDLREVLDLLSERGGLNILAGKDVQGKVSASLTGVDINSALDAILKSTGYTTRRQGKFIFVGTQEEFNSIEQALDRVGTRVYRPNYVTAAELKILIQPLMTEKVGMASVSTPAEAGIAANDSTVGGDKFAGGDVVLVRDYEAVLAQVDQVVAEVDVRPLQVCIEAMVLNVKLDDTDTFGVDFELLGNHMKFGWGTPPETLGSFKFDDGGLKFGYLDSNVGIFVQALEKISTTEVIAKPRLMVLNKHRAEILIGDKKGYVSTTVTETASTQAVDFLETGAQLRLRPFISSDGLIRMEVHPELSDGDVVITDKFTLPNKTVTEVTTNIMVRDGCTVVIGGLMKDQKTNSTSAVPVLGALPWVGAAFRHTTETTQRHELIVLITPRIIYEPATCQEGSRAACEFERRQAVCGEKMSPLGRRHIARRYVRLAAAAWAKGDRDTALRFAEMAVHFDPLSREAIELRANIWQGKPYTLAPFASEAEAAGAAPAPGSPPRPGSPEIVATPAPSGMGLIDGPQIAPWVLEELKREGPPPQPALLHPLDPGRPGLHREIPRPRSLQ